MQDGVPTNSLYITTKTDCKVIAVNEMAEDMADDYHVHVMNWRMPILISIMKISYTVDNDKQNIKHTEKKRVAVNHDVIKNQ